MFGYATDETEELMPLTIMLAHNLNKKLSECRRDGSIKWLKPDSKTQVEQTINSSLHVLLTMHTFR